MYYLFLDETGDLGFDFQKKGTTNYFVVTVLLIKGTADRKTLERAVVRTIRLKVHKGKRREKRITELKGSRMGFPVKQYFYEQAKGIDFEIYAVAFNKKRVDLPRRWRDKIRIYESWARLVIDKIPLQKAQTRIDLTLDKFQLRTDVKEFIQYLKYNLRTKIPVSTSLNIHSLHSYESKCLQAVDMFSWGIFRKYERQDLLWYNVFQDKIVLEQAYPP